MLFSLITCGFYLIYWYFKTLGEMADAGHSSTGNAPILDFLIAVVTCGIYGIFVDYRISKAIVELQQDAALPINDTAVLVVLLDIFGLSVITSAIHQNELNKLWSSGGPVGFH